tara:strand:+ start:497 stop:814 length:318 start_codon:yes stop_codon:yes gene_type:complete
MFPTKGFKAYKQYWEDQAGFMDHQPWDENKILKLTISNNLDHNFDELKFSNHSLKKENGEYVLRIKIPFNHCEIDNFELKAIELLGLQQKNVTRISIENSHCSHR